MVLASKVMSWTQSESLWDAAEAETDTRLMGGPPPPPWDQVVSPPPSPPSQRSSSSGSGSVSIPKNMGFEELRAALSDSEMRALLETKSGYLARLGLTRMPEGADLVRGWDGRLHNLSLPKPKIHWASTAYAPTLHAMGPQRTREKLDRQRRAYVATLLHGRTSNTTARWWMPVPTSRKAHC